MIAASAYGLIAYLVGNAIYASYLAVPYVPGVGELTVIYGITIVGAGLGIFMVQRAACVFMGTGSLALAAPSGPSPSPPSTRSCLRLSAGFRS
ncbi:MAG: hypothetical protein R3C40_09345 [Parvularculaceae bacterium]